MSADSPSRAGRCWLPDGLCDPGYQGWPAGVQESPPVTGLLQAEDAHECLLFLEPHQPLEGIR